MDIKKNFIRFEQKAVFTLAMLLLGGCASTGTLHTLKPMTVKLANYKTMGIDVSSQVPESSQEAIQLETMVIVKLRDRGLFEKIFSQSASPEIPADLRLNVKVVNLKKVSAEDRVMLGALAGRAKIVVDVELIDLKTEETIGAFKAEGQSSGGTVFAGTTSQAIERAVEQIVQFVQDSM